jgi:transcriptional regulator with XRE-family HTH domain
MATDSMRNPAIYAAIGENVKRVRDAIGMTQQGLATRVGFLRTSVVNIEQGRQRVPIDTLDEIASALGVTLGDLLPSSHWPTMTPQTAEARIRALEAKLEDTRLMLTEIIAEL